MTIFILVSILLVAALAIALLMGVSPASQKVKVRTMYVGAALMLVVALVVCDYIDALPDFPSKFRFHAVLVLTVTVGYLCIAIACMEKYNVLKRKNRVLEEALTEKEQEKVSILMEHQSKQQQALQKGELEYDSQRTPQFINSGKYLILPFKNSLRIGFYLQAIRVVIANMNIEIVYQAELPFKQVYQFGNPYRERNLIRLFFSHGFLQY